MRPHATARGGVADGVAEAQDSPPPTLALTAADAPAHELTALSGGGGNGQVFKNGVASRIVAAGQMHAAVVPPPLSVPSAPAAPFGEVALPRREADNHALISQLALVPTGATAMLPPVSGTSPAGAFPVARAAPTSAILGPLTNSLPPTQSTTSETASTDPFASLVSFQ